MRYFVLLFVFCFFTAEAKTVTKSDPEKWQLQANRVEIIRDNWGIPHIYGKSDADAVFGLIYAQCEDDFNRVEMNYIEKLGRISEIKGEAFLYNDLYIRMVIDSLSAKQDYIKAPGWLKKLLNAYADGINYYLFKHPEQKPFLINHFEPWYPLLWTDGSIGAISTGDITVGELKSFYTGVTAPITSIISKLEENTSGSNGFAIAPSKTASGKSILYINPHVTFYFRPEVHMVSESGLNVYGAVTWGQFFIYQGFNEHCGWMHTSSAVDVSDLYIEKIVKKEDGWHYEFDDKLLKVREKKETVYYTEGKKKLSKSFNTLYTHHGPIMTSREGKYISVRATNRSLTGLIQSWTRTKATSFKAYKKVMDLKANTSNNTVYADAEGNIAYWHGNYIPVRNPKLNWSKPVDGTNRANDWKGLHSVNESIHIYNPSNGWIQNCNSTPYTASGQQSPKKKDYPAYMAPDGENFRGINAQRVLEGEAGFTIDKTIAAGYDNYLSAFEVLIPELVKAFEGNKLKYDRLSEPMEMLRVWDYRSSISSVATSLAIEWAQKLGPSISKIYIDDEELDQVEKTKVFSQSAEPNLLLSSLQEVIDQLNKNHGSWKIPWGDLNRFQRISSDINQKFTDAAPSLPVPFASSLWGMLPAYNSIYYPGTNKRYGVSGNSFVCAVEFGTKIKAKSLLAGGESGDPASKHFDDQALMYTQGKFKEVNFYREDVLKNGQRTYHPGD